LALFPCVTAIKEKFSLMLERFSDFYPHNIGVETGFLLLILVALESVLSADNAIALASIAQGLPEPKIQRQALNFGLLAAFILRIALIFTATWVIHFWQFELLGALYLLWLVFQYFISSEGENNERSGPKYSSLWQAIPIIAMTDLAFSLDSVTTAIAVSSEIWLVVTGATIGIIALRFMAGLFIRWLDEYVHLEDAGYITVGLVGLRLLLRVVSEDIVLPEWFLISSVLVLFIWGFSLRKPETELENSMESTTSPDAPETSTLPEPEEAIQE
jgi:YkoY family integral membrane protein